MILEIKKIHRALILIIEGKAMFKKLSIAAAAATIAMSVFAQTPEEKGLEIATEQEARGYGFVDSSATMQMTLINKAGKTSERMMSVMTLEGPTNDGDKSLTVFNSPRDVEGTALLTHTHKVGSDDQWLFLPALKRVKRIASKNKSGPFMGSEFAFEDLSGRELEKYTYKYLRDEEVNGLNCFVVESIPLDKDSGYTRLVSWIDQAEYRAQKVEYFDRKKSHLKSLEVIDQKLYLDKFWRPSEMFMQNHQTGKSTRLQWTDYKFQTGLTDRDFTENSLKRAR